MRVVAPFIGATVIVFFAYLVLWLSTRPDTPANVSKFGNVLTIVILVIAGLALAAGLICPMYRCGPGFNGHCKAGMMQQGCRGGNMGQGIMEGSGFGGREGMPCMKGRAPEQQDRIPQEDREPAAQK